MMAGAQATFADLKIKSKMTMSGQSYENTTYIKGKRQRAETTNGMMVNITQCDLRRAIQMNPATKTFIINEFGKIEPSEPSAGQKVASQPVTKGGKVVTTINIKDTGERKKMFGYDARHLIITMDTQSSPDACSKGDSKMELDGWYIDFGVGFECDEQYTTNRNPVTTTGGCQDKFEFRQSGSGKRGYAVYEKMTMFDENGKESMTMVTEVVELSKATLTAGLFEVPKDYREVSDVAAMYATSGAASSSTMMSSSSGSMTSSQDQPTMSLPNTAQPSANATSVLANSPKQAGFIRVGLAHVKTGAVGKGLSASDLAAAVQNTLVSYLKVPNVEVVVLEGRLPAAIESEAATAECDYVVYAEVSHKKGGGGFGGSFGSMVGSTIAGTALGQMGGAVGVVAGQVASQTISAATMSEQMKSKDEITLDVKLNKSGGAALLGKQYKAKAKSDGDDIISQVIEQAAQNIVDLLGK